MYHLMIFNNNYNNNTVKTYIFSESNYFKMCVYYMKTLRMSNVENIKNINIRFFFLLREF